MRTSLRFALVVGALAAVGVVAMRRERTVDCPPRERLVVVDTRRHALALCKDGKADETFGVRLGKNGTGKTREGDEKTPLGRYALSEPRASAKFGIFVPIGYPTLEQARAGYTGSAVGIHGPGRFVRWLGPFVNAMDLSDGCVGIATDAEMNRVATWTRAQGIRQVELR